MCSFSACVVLMSLYIVYIWVLLYYSNYNDVVSFLWYLCLFMLNCNDFIMNSIKAVYNRFFHLWRCKKRPFPFAQTAHFCVYKEILTLLLMHTGKVKTQLCLLWTRWFIPFEDTSYAAQTHYVFLLKGSSAYFAYRTLEHCYLGSTIAVRSSCIHFLKEH